MNKNIFFICFILFFSFPVYSQMIDMISNLSIQGQIGTQGVVGLNKSFSLIQQNEIINKLNMIIMEAKLIDNKNNISKSQFSGYPLNNVDWDIIPVNANNFALLLKNIDKSFCTKLISVFNYQEIYINENKSKICVDKNNLKFIF